MVYTAFTQVVPRENVFMDIDSIPLGADFRKILKGWVDECDVMLALIGPGWISASDPKTEQRRLTNPADFVRIEISEALAREIPVVPVLLDGAPMPDPELLPDDLKELVYRHAEFVEYSRFDHDVNRLIKKLGLGATPPAPPAAPSIQRAATANQPSDEDGYRAEGRIYIDAPIVDSLTGNWFLPGDGNRAFFKDIDVGPEMVVVPAGAFMMGGGSDARSVTIEAPFAVARYPTTFDEWDFAFAEDGVGHEPSDDGWGRGSRPVINVSWNDVKEYAAWLSQATGKTYRLLSEVEWEYCCRAGTTTHYSFGDMITKQQAQFSEGEWGSAKHTVEVGSFPANAWGLYDMHGNVFEWCEDTNVSPFRVLRGGFWGNLPEEFGSANSIGLRPDDRDFRLGFRLARTL